MKHMVTAIVVVGALGGAVGAHAAETTGVAGDHAITFSATPTPPAVQMSRADILAIANQAKPIRPKAPVDTKTAPTLK